MGFLSNFSLLKKNKAKNAAIISPNKLNTYLSCSAAKLWVKQRATTMANSAMRLSLPIGLATLEGSPNLQ